MLISAGSVERGRRIETDVCIVGCGPAGITLATQLKAPGLRIVVLESGGQEFDRDAQALCDGTTVSADGYPGDRLVNSRRRQLGGTANLWDDELDEGKGEELQRLVPLAPIDFEKRDWVPYSGWPLGRSDLEPFYEQALRFSGAGLSAFDAHSWQSDRPELLPPEARLQTMMSQFGARSLFTNKYPEMLARDNDSHIYLNATLLELVLKDNAIQFARVAGAPDREFEVAARFFVVAAGGIENARLLLLSNRIQPSGLGNQYDLVGRFFMDHPAFRLGVLTPRNRKLFNSAGLYDHHVVNGIPVMGKLVFREEIMRREKMLNICVTLTPRRPTYESPAINVLKRVRNSDSAGTSARLLKKEFGCLISGWDEVLVRCYEKIAGRKLQYSDHKGGWSRMENNHRRFRRLELICLCEQAPNPQNRVTLGDTLDRFGQRKVELHWRWSEADLRSVRRAQEILKDEFEQQELGGFVGQYEFDAGKAPDFLSPHHHIGTTRIHSNPREGVVDANCRVHGLANLYVAGSSVFPTAGFANPTLTIIALAMRLSYHLKELMKSPLPSISGTLAQGAALDEA